jgi:hypothetical protein
MWDVNLRICDERGDMTDISPVEIERFPGNAATFELEDLVLFEVAGS